MVLFWFGSIRSPLSQSACIEFMYHGFSTFVPNVCKATFFPSLALLFHELYPKTDFVRKSPCQASMSGQKARSTSEWLLGVCTSYKNNAHRLAVSHPFQNHIGLLISCAFQDKSVAVPWLRSVKAKWNNTRLVTVDCSKFPILISNVFKHHTLVDIKAECRHGMRYRGASF
jgi:hypothetical protein